MSIVSKFSGMKTILEKKQKNKFFKYKEYDVEFYEKPFLQKNLELHIKINKNIDDLNQKFNFNYGIFNKEHRDFILKNSFLMLVFENHKIIGCFNVFQFETNLEKVCYQGIYCSLKKENSFMHLLGLKLNSFIFNRIGKFNMVSLTNLPYVAYLLYSGFDNVFPHPNNMKKPDKKKREILKSSVEIIKKYFSEKNENFVFHEKRSVLSIENNQVSSKKLIDQPRAPTLLVNSMFQFLLENSQNETILFVGEYNYYTKIKNSIRIITFQKFF